MKKLKLRSIGIFCLAFLFVGGVAYAASTSDFSQTINAGTLTTDIKDDSRVTVASPSVTMSAKNFSFDCYDSGDPSTGTFGTNTERIYVTNGDAADDGWTLTLAATSGNTATWSTGSAYIDFNDTTGSGCTDGADAGDSVGGLLTIDPSVGTLTADCTSCDNTNITKGSSDNFEEGVTDNITLLTAAAGSDDVYRGYLTGVDLDQYIPGETGAGAYTLNFTLTVAAT